MCRSQGRTSVRSMGSPNMPDHNVIPFYAAPTIEVPPLPGYMVMQLKLNLSYTDAREIIVSSTKDVLN